MIENLHTLLTSIEDLYETGRFNGPEERFFGIVEKTASMRPVSSSANSNNLSKQHNKNHPTLLVRGFWSVETSSGAINRVPRPLFFSPRPMLCHWPAHFFDLSHVPRASNSLQLIKYLKN